ncbi:MAG: DUF501 domain-containing protein [Acidimicrobiales bacterium]
MNEADLSSVTELLGRVPRGACEVAARTVAGCPVVIKNAPHLDDGTPMPTLYWLVGRQEREAVSGLEAAGGVKAAEQAADPLQVAAAHDRYARERASAGSSTPRPSALSGSEHQPSGGVGGTRKGVKCLHAHLAWWLVGGEDPIGEWTAAKLGIERAGYRIEHRAALAVDR